MIDMIKPDQEFSVAKYKEMALECIVEVIRRRKVPILVGGTGLYINSIVDNVEFSETITDWEYREQLQKRAEREGVEVLHEELKKVDPDAAQKIHINDLKRIIRALEVYKFTGKPISFHQQISREKPAKFDFIMIGLTMERGELYERIDKRVDQMLEKGLEDEVKKLLDRGINIKSTAMQGLGYKEIVEYLTRNKSLEEVLEIIKRDSRRYAKRQLTWFRRDKKIYWLNVENGVQDILKKIFIYLEANGMFM